MHYLVLIDRTPEICLSFGKKKRLLETEQYSMLSSMVFTNVCTMVHTTCLTEVVEIG